VPPQRLGATTEVLEEQEQGAEQGRDRGHDGVVGDRERVQQFLDRGPDLVGRQLDCRDPV
jgi:hypothetical protein